MFCGNCGNEVSANAVACMKCGANPKIVVAHCTNCGNNVAPNAVVCTNCGVGLTKTPTGVGKSRVMVGLMGLFFGSLGVHNFILGYTGKAVAQLLISLLGVWLFGLGPIASGIWALIESIMILTGKINEDAHGVPLTD